MRLGEFHVDFLFDLLRHEAPEADEEALRQWEPQCQVHDSALHRGQSQIVLILDPAFDVNQKDRIMMDGGT